MFEVFNQTDGTLVTSITSNIPKFLGHITITTGGGASGTVTDASLAGREFWYQLNYTQDTTTIGMSYPQLNVTRSGNTITWSWPTQDRVNCYITYGIY